jgi:ribonucleotide monophosphatase NagD (HAD superfamily)
VTCFDLRFSSADTLVLTASLKSKTKEYLEPIITHLKADPQMPVICANPDRYIMGINGLFPVMGYYADHVESSINRPLFWMGKPEKNFSHVVGHILKSNHNITPNNECIFFDDNYKNVVRLTTDLTISGTWITKTGLGKDYSDSEIQTILNAHPDLTAIDSLAHAKHT